MRLTVIETPQGRPVGLDEFKLHLRVDTTDEDVTITSYLDAATQAIGTTCNLTLIPTVIRAEYLDGWPLYEGFGARCGLDLGTSPIRLVREVNYLDKDGARQIVDDDMWYAVPTLIGASVFFKPAFTFPELGRNMADAGVRIEFEAGFDLADEGASGNTPGFTLPPMIKPAIMLLGATWYTNRESVVAARTVQQLPDAVDRLLYLTRIYR